MPGDPELVAIIRDIFDLHYRQGWGGKRIADHLNRRGIASPNGRNWSQHQVEVIYHQEAYTGRSVGNRVSAAIFHRRRTAAPEEVDLDPAVHVRARTMPAQLRPPDQWFVQDQPMMASFLGDEPLRQLAIEGQNRYWQHIADPNREKLSKSKHKTSEYLLTGLLFAKQDGEPLVGILCGRVDKKVRYYRHRRGRRGYMKNAVFNKLIHAPTVEAAVLNAVKATLLAGDDLRPRILAIIRQQTEHVDTDRLEDLRKQREQLRKRAELIVSTLDEETLAEARGELDRLKSRRREIDQQIGGLESAGAIGAADPEAIADAVVEQLRQMTATASDLPIAALRAWLGTVVEKVVVDLETKNIDIRLMLPTDLIRQSAKSGEKAMRLVGTSASSTDYKTHRHPAYVIADIRCQFEKSSSTICYRCGRRAA